MARHLGESLKSELFQANIISIDKETQKTDIEGILGMSNSSEQVEANSGH